MIWEPGDYAITRAIFQRGLGIVFFLAFLCALNQFRPLAGEHGLLPVSSFVGQVSFRQAPSLFFFAPKDWAFSLATWLGTGLSLMVIAGVADRWTSWINALVWLAIWVLYLSFVNVGRTFYAFGWESILLEAGFLAIFLGSRHVRTPIVVIYLFRWLEFRVMFGAGLIKLRGDSCWRDLTCLNYHYETQPMPNPLSWYFHNAPVWTQTAGVVFNHFSELAVPFLYFLPQPAASLGGILTILFQGLIFASGNLSWLNFLTMILAIPAIDGRYFAGILPAYGLAPGAPSPVHRALAASLGILMAFLSIQPIRNLISPGQVMNASYNPFHLAGTYGAFGGITRQRYEIVVEGTSDATVTASTQWKEYEFKGKPTDLHRMPPQIAPYHLRLDWLMWFAAMSSYDENPWFVNFMAKLLENDRPILSLLQSNPFPDSAPRYVRAELYEYRFASPDKHRETGQWWIRTRAGSYFPQVSLENRSLQRILRSQGWQ